MNEFNTPMLQRLKNHLDSISEDQYLKLCEEIRKEFGSESDVEHEWKMKNNYWLKYSKYITDKILFAINVTLIWDKELLSKYTNIELDRINLLLQGNTDYRLSEIVRLSDCLRLDLFNLKPEVPERSCSNCYRDNPDEQGCRAYCTDSLRSHQYSCKYCSHKLPEGDNRFCEMDDGEDGMSCCGDKFDLKINYISNEIDS